MRKGRRASKEMDGVGAGGSFQAGGGIPDRANHSCLLLWLHAATGWDGACGSPVKARQSSSTFCCPFFDASRPLVEAGSCSWDAGSQRILRRAPQQRTPEALR